MTNNDYLAHYGVKGMKWGVRRSGKKLVKRKRQLDKAERKWRDTPKNTGARGRNYYHYRVKKNLYERQRLRDKQKTVGLSTKETNRYNRLGLTENLYRAQRTAKIGSGIVLAGSAVTYGALLNPTGRKALSSGAKTVAKYASMVYDNYDKAQNFKSGIYINEKGRRQYVKPNFGGSTRLVG